VTIRLADIEPAVAQIVSVTWRRTFSSTVERAVERRGHSIDA
jgi:hypothetical protein